MAGPKHTVSIMACARAETAYITEWLLYHQAIGFDHVYLYCNDEDPTALYGEVLPFSRGDAPFVTFQHFPFQGQQFYMMMHALRHYKDAAEWVAFLDLDEFLVLPALDDIQAFLRRCPAHWDAIHFNTSLFGNNFHAERPSGSVLLNYTRREDQLHPSTKTLTRSAKIDLSRIADKVSVWHGWGGILGPGCNAVNVLGDAMELVNGSDEGASYVKPGEIQARIRKTAVVNHYAFKSLRDIERRTRPDGFDELDGQTSRKHLTDSDGAASSLASINVVEDTYLADYWRRFLRGCENTRIVPPSPFPNVALGKQAEQSSHSEWSNGTTTRQDAAGVVNGRITGKAQCHTSLETRPWWMVDLGAPHLIYEVRVFNRVDQPGLRQRLGAFRIEIADAAGPWVPLHEHDGRRLVGGADGYPLIVKPPAPVVASRLRVIALGHTYLHLDQVQVHGVPVADSADAAATLPPIFHPLRSATTPAGLAGGLGDEVVLRNQ